MDIKEFHVGSSSSRADSNNSPSSSPVAPAAQEAQQTWSILRSQLHKSDASMNSSNDYHHPSEQRGPFASRHRSLAASTSSEEDGLVRARRHDPHQFARLLDPRRDNKADRNTYDCSKELEPAHIPILFQPVGLGTQFTKPQSSPLAAQHSESPSHTSDVESPFQRKLSHHHQDSSLAANYRTPKPRKSLHERLQGEQSQQSRHLDSSNALNQWSLDQTPTPVKHEQMSPLHPAVNITALPEGYTVLEGENDGGSASILNGKASGADIDARSGSVSLGNFSVEAKGMQGMVMEALKTVQRYESENEIQRSEIERLSARVALVEKEKDQLKNQVKLVKSTSLQKLATNSQSLEALRVDLARLKADAQKTTSTAEARTLIGDIKEMKIEVTDALKTSNLYLIGCQGDNELPGIRGRTREVMADLQLDCMNKQQVLDMLRDRLDDALSNLAASRDREIELENAYAADRLALKNAAIELTATSSRINDLASALKRQQSESLDNMILAGDLEMQLEASKCQVSRLEKLIEEYERKATVSASLENSMFQLQTLVETQKSELRHLIGASNENIQLKATAEAREDRLRILEEGLAHSDAIKESNAKLETQLEELKHKLNTCDAERVQLLVSRDSVVASNVQLKTQLSERESKLKLMECEFSSKTDLVDDLRTSMGKVQASLETSDRSIKRLDAELASSRASEATEKAQRLEAVKEKIFNEQQLVVAERRVDDLVNQSENYRKRFEELNTRFQCLQERFEEQSITLRLTRDTAAELQDRLVAAETSYAKNLEATCGTLRMEIAILREQNDMLQVQVKQNNLHAESYRKDCTARETTLVEQIEDRRKDFEASCGDLRVQIAILQEQNSTLQVHLKQSKLDAETRQREALAKEATLLQRNESSIRELETTCGDLRTQVAVLREQNSTQQVHLKEMKTDAEEHRQEYQGREAALLQRIEDTRKELEQEVHRGSDVKIQSDREVTEHRLQNVELQSRIADLQSQLQAAPAPSTLHEEIEALKTQANRVGLECEALKQRSRTLNGRFDSGDLDAEERALIKKIIEATQSMHDHELAQTRNELHRKDNLITTLRDAKVVLENSLVKHLEAEARIKTTAVKSGASVMDFVNWPSSQSDLSVLSVPPAQDRDEPSTAPEDPPAQEDTEPAPIPTPKQVVDSPYCPLASAARSSAVLTPGLAGASVDHNLVTPSAGPSYFLTLAPDGSDEIADFDETTGTKRKKELPPQTGKPESSKQHKRAKTTTRSETQGPEGGTAKTTYASKSKRKRR